MKSTVLLRIAAVLAGLQVGSCWEHEKRFTNASTTAGSATSSSSSSTITAAPTYCGNCTIYYEVHAHIWWSKIFTTYAATWLYTVDKDSGSTIGSSLQIPSNTTQVQYPNFTQYIMNPDGGAIEYTTLNTLGAADLTTIIAENTISMTGPNNIYLMSTSFYNETLSKTVCAPGAFYYAPLPSTGTAYNASKTISTVSGVPASTTYTYTTSAYNFGPNYTLAVPLAYGLDSLATAVGSVLGLSSACVIGGGGGVGTLKVGVTALTTSSTIYAVAQAITTPNSSPAVVAPTPTPTPSPVSQPEIKTKPSSTNQISSTAEIKIKPSSTDQVSSSAEIKTKPTTTTEISLPPYTPSTIISQPVSITPASSVVTPATSSPGSLASISPVPISPSPISTSTPPPNSPLPNSPSSSSPLSSPSPDTSSPPNTVSAITASYTTTYITTLSNSLGIETLSVTATLPIGSILGSYTITLVKTTEYAGSTASQTISEVVTLPLASYILSLLGGDAATTTVSAVKTSSGAGGIVSGTATGSGEPAQFTGGVGRSFGGDDSTNGLGMVVWVVVAVVLI